MATYLQKRGSLYVLASGIFATGTENGIQYRIYKGGKIIGSEWVRAEPRREQESAIRGAFPGLSFYGDASGVVVLD